MFFSLIIIMKKSTNVAIKNLKKVNVKGGIKGAESFAAIKAPPQNKVDKIIKKYTLESFISNPPYYKIL